MIHQESLAIILDMHIALVFIRLAAAAACVSPALATPLTTVNTQTHNLNNNTEGYCAGTSFTPSLLSTYLCGDWRLGPILLPSTPPLSSHILELYHRLGQLTPAAFLEKYWRGDSLSGFWIYPEQNGFSLDVRDEAILGDLELPAGMLIDRFGSEYGRFFSSASAPYLQRALPPSNLDTPQDNPQ